MRRSFSEKVISLLRRIPRGKVTTYTAVAARLHSRGYRAVGNALHANALPDVFPCHRVVCSDGSVGGYALGRKEKIRRLERDGIRVSNGRIADFRRVLYSFK